MECEAAQEAAVGGASFRELLLADADVSAALDAATIDRLLDPTTYTGACASMAREQAARGRALSAELAAH